MINIRPANIDDASGIAMVHVGTWKTAYKGVMPNELLANISYEKRENAWHEILSDGNGRIIFVAEDRQGRIVGFVSGGKERDNNPSFKGELYGIYVLDQWQKKGVGRRLVHELVMGLIACGLDTMIIWTLEKGPSCGFYERLGGRKVASKTATYGGKDLVVIAYGWDDLHALADSMKLQ